MFCLFINIKNDGLRYFLRGELMNESRTLLGYTNYNNNDYTFIYENGVLTLLPARKITEAEKWGNFRDTFKQHNDEINENISILGTTNSGKKVMFLLNSSDNNDNGFIQFYVICVYVYWDEELINGLIVTSDEINYFFNPSRVFDTEIKIDDKKNKEVRIKTGTRFNEEVNCGEYKHKNITVKLKVSAYYEYMNQSYEPLTAKSQILLEFSEGVKIDRALDIINDLRLFLSYICYRKNIEFHSINVINNFNKEKGYISFISNDNSETNGKKEKQILKSDLLLKESVGKIFQEISNGKIYVEHFCNSIDEKSTYNISRFILIFAAFEREYSNFFEDAIARSQDYNIAKKKAIDTLESLRESMANGRQKKYISNFIYSINKDGISLEEKIKKTISEHKTIMVLFLRYRYGNEDYEEIINQMAERINKIRNDVAHGNLGLKFESIHLSDITILEILIYVVRLKSLNIPEENIKKMICNLFGFNLAI